MPGRSNFERAFGRPRGHCVTDGILDKRLQDELGHLCIERLRVDVNDYCQSIMKSRLLYFKIAVQEIHFFSQRHFMGVSVSQDKAEQLAKSQKQSVGESNVLHEVTLREEVDLLHSYLEIEQTRFH